MTSIVSLALGGDFAKLPTYSDAVRERLDELRWPQERRLALIVCIWALLESKRELPGFPNTFTEFAEGDVDTYMKFLAAQKSDTLLMKVWGIYTGCAC